MNVIIKLGDQAGTSITPKDAAIGDVLKEWESALAEGRMMTVGMERAGYVHRVNPHQVVLVQELEY
jgi:uncharacterized protein (DUF952 family)